MNTKWTPVTATDPKPDESLIDFTLTPQEHDIARLAMVEILAKQKKAEFGQFTPDLVVTELNPSELTEQERESFLMWGGTL